jgi:DNA-binding CsgD family transcriptional regulator
VIFGAPLRELWRVLFEMTKRRPVVLSVDDVHHIDEESLDSLLYLVRRLRSARLFLVVGERSHLRRDHSPLLSDVLSLPGARRIDLQPLSGRGVRTLLAEQLGSDAAQRLGRALHRISAGNPALLHALIEDQRVAELERPDTDSAGRDAVGLPAVDRGAEESAEVLAVGQGHSRAVLRLLERGDPLIAETARGIAILGEQASPRLLSKLLGFDLESAVRGIASLTVAGVYDGERFRHEGVKTAVLSGLAPDEYMDLNTRAVHLLREEGASAPVVARHLVAANGLDDQWVVPVLEDAAREALADGQLDAATGHLRMAIRICKDWTQRTTLLAALAEVQWRSSPAAAAQYLPELSDAVRDGALTWSASVFTVAGLLWHGSLKEGRRVLRAFGEQVARGVLPMPEEAEAVTSLLLLSLLYPELTPDITEIYAAALNGGEASSGAFQLQSTGDLAEALATGDSVKVLAGAEAVLQNPQISDALLVPYAIGLVVLAGKDLDKAATRADMFLEERDVTRQDTWHAMIMAIRGLISMRTGAPAEAADLAEQALKLLSAKDWGIFVGLPLSVLITARTTLGQHKRLSEVFSYPVPEMMFLSPIGLFHLHARGLYRLATGRSHAALGDFEMCGKLMDRWGIDLPEIIPWRSDAVRACLATGDVERARTLASDQLAMLEPDRLRPRGQSLRVLAAATADATSRHRLLGEAVEVLQASGDRLELARAIADLSRVSHELGNSGEARSLAQRADRLFQWCGLAPDAPVHAAVSEASRPRRPARGGAKGNGRPRPRAGTRVAKRAPHAPGGQELAGRIAELSAAEQRVASLAAQGHSNRQISDMLYITISTVEQHLTRIYRKLNVTDRLDLPVDLQLESER